jgi:GNAT superfamily N-acetyltransferase
MLANVDGFARYLASLVGSWEALAVPHPDAAVVRGAGFVAARFPDPVLNNAVVLDPSAVAGARGVFAGTDRYAIWTLDEHVAAAAEAAGLRRDVTTRPMLRRLQDVPSLPDRLDPGAPPVLRDVDPAEVATLNRVAADLLLGVPGLRTYAIEGDITELATGLVAGLVALPVGTDVNISFVATRGGSRRRGLASALVRAALHDAGETGSRTASLQATPMAERLYARLGFEPVGHWQEWVPRP